MSAPEVHDSEQWSQPRHYGGPGSAPGTTSSEPNPGGHDEDGRTPATEPPEPLRPLAGPGDSAMFAVALATGSDASWSTPSYHGPRRHRPQFEPTPAEYSEPPAAAHPVETAGRVVTGPDVDAAVEAGAGPSLMSNSSRMAVASLASRVTGFLRTLVLAAALGSGSYGIAEAYNLANTLPNMVYELLLGGVLTSVIIPILVKAQHDDEDDGIGYTQRLLTIVVTGLAAGTVLAVLAAPLLIGFFGGPRQFHVVAVLWASLLLPEIFFYGLGAMLSAVLNTRNVYGWPAWAPVLNNLITIAALGLFVLVPGPSILTTGTITNTQILIVGIGTTLGIAGQALVLLIPLRRLGFSWQWRLRARPNEAGRLSEFRTLSLWVLGYVAISQVGVIVINKVALAAPEGGVSIFAYADLFFQVPYGILGVSLLTALMPRMSRAAAQNDTAAVLRDLRLGTRLSAVALVPVTAGLMVFGPSFTTVVLVGHYSHNARLTGVALAFGAFGLLPFALVMLQQRVFYAMRDTRTPTLINVAMVATKVILVIVAGQVLSGRNVIIALTVSTSLSYVAGAIAGHILLRRRFGPLGFTSVARTVGWIAIAAVTGALAGLAVLVGIGAVLGSGRTTALVQLVLGCAVGIAVLAAAASRLPLPEVQDVLGAIRGRRASRSAQ